MAIDHVLVTRQFSAISTRTYRVDGTDHRALLARLEVR
jgi:endonuclease/exonuclease/phosphatase (EEP) superfamily protein YafD